MTIFQLNQIQLFKETVLEGQIMLGRHVKIHHWNRMCTKTLLMALRASMEALRVIVSANRRASVVGSGQNTREKYFANVSSKALKFSLNISSDYQQNWHVLAWNVLPQPVQTYFMSKITIFFYSFCCESFGDTKGQYQFKQNRLYAR